MKDETEMKTKPNILLIVTDHWPASLLGCAGHPVIKTPTIDRMAQNGIRYTNCYSTCPVCIPARRSLMTGTTPKTHGDRVYTETMSMPDIPTLAQCFRDSDYQAYGIGKLHVYPQRNRIGFDDVILAEEARYSYHVVDDYQIWLGENGYTGKEYMHGMGNNVYYTRPWHLPEEAHATNWTTHEAIRMIKRKDPTRPAFYYVSYVHPHPPLVPLQCYLDMYPAACIDEPFSGNWITDPVYYIRKLLHSASNYSRDDITAARRAFYALCTHIDHQLRLLIGTLREEKLLENTIIIFTSDHGEMLGNFGLFQKRLFYENSANIPFIISGKPLESDCGITDDRLTCLEDIMPTLLDLCDIEIPRSVEGISAVADTKRQILYGEINENSDATRMIHNGRYKLIYYPAGNYIQIFDIINDHNERNNLFNKPEVAEIQRELTQSLISYLYKDDENWVENNELVGLPEKEFIPKPDYNFSSQRGGHWPPPIGN